MMQGNAATAIRDRSADADDESRVRDQLRAALESELTADARDPRMDADGGRFGDAPPAPPKPIS